MSDIKKLSLNGVNYDLVSVSKVTIDTPFIKHELVTTNGTKFIVSGGISKTFNFNIPYGSGYLADFAFDIPRNARPSNGFYGAELSCLSDSFICFPTYNYIAADRISGYLWSPININNKNVLLSFIGYGY